MERLHWQCRRGMLELDELFSRFLSKGYLQLDADGRVLFNDFLSEADPELYQWLLAGDACPERYTELVQKVRRNE